MRYIISKETQFDAGHRVPNHASKCRNPHGHRYRVVVSFTGPLVTKDTASDFGMVVDFGMMSAMLRQHVHDPYDHGMIVWEHDMALRDALAGHGWHVVVVPFVPTAENLASHLFATLSEACAAEWGGNVMVESVQVYETPTGVAMVTA